MLIRIAANVFETSKGVRVNSRELVSALGLAGVTDVEYRNIGEFRNLYDDEAVLSYVDRLEVVLDKIDSDDFRKIRNCFGSILCWFVEPDGDGQIRWSLDIEYSFVAKLVFEQVFEQAA